METPIIPFPRRVTKKEGEFPLDSLLRAAVDGPGADQQVGYLADQVTEVRRHFEQSPLQMERTKRAEANLLLRVDNRSDKVGHEEGYFLAVDPGQITVEACAAGGLFYGIQSLLQLLAAHERGIPCQVIEDEPRFRWRGMHLDVCRHFFSSRDVKQFIDLLALHKLNTFHWHLTEDQGWRLPVPQYPRLAEISAWRDEGGERYGGCYTEDEIVDVVEYAAARRIRILPEVEMPGHAVAAIAAYPEFSCRGKPLKVETTWGIFDDVFCAGNDQVFEFLTTVLDQVRRLFPCEYIHIGGDECPKTRWQACPRCQQRIRDESLGNEDELQSWFIRAIARYLEEHGRILIGWDEIMEGGLASGATVMSWRGTEGGIRAAQQGHDVIMSPTSHCYFDYKQADSEDEPGAHGVIPLETVYAFEPVPESLTAEQRLHILGGQGNVWTERMAGLSDVQYMVLPRMSALAETLWSPAGSRDFARFHDRLTLLCRQFAARQFAFRPLGATASTPS